MEFFFKFAVSDFTDDAGVKNTKLRQVNFQLCPSIAPVLFHKM